MTTKIEKQRISTARAGWIATLVICLGKVLAGGISTDFITFEPVDYSGMAMLLGAVGAVHWSREHTRANSE